MTDDTGGAQAERSGRRQRRARLVDITLAGLFLLLLASSLANLYLRREANRIKKDRPVMVVIGNPPYKERSHGQGAWIESGTVAGPPPPPGTLTIPNELHEVRRIAEQAQRNRVYLMTPVLPTPQFAQLLGLELL